MKKTTVLLLCLVILCSAFSTSGCSKKANIDVEALAKVLCFFDESEIDVERIEKMTMFRDEGESWYVYKIAVTVHTNDGDINDVLGTLYDPSESISNRTFYDSEKEISYNGHNPSAGVTFVVWRMTENNRKNGEISEIPKEDIPNIVARAWKYIEENNIHPEEEE